MGKNLYKLLQECSVEKNVEAKYHEIFKYYFPKSEINSPFRTDGILTDKEIGIKILIESKYMIDLNDSIERNKLIIQGLYYLKKLERLGEELPTILFCGDKNECFYIHTNILIPLLNLNLDWSISPSEAPSKNPELLSKELATPFVEHIDNDHFDFGIVVEKIIQLHKGTIQKIRITELNINRFFSYFRDRVLIEKKKHTAENLVSIFLGCLLDSTSNYLHPKKKNILVTPTEEIRVNSSNFKAFFEKFESDYSLSEKQRLTSICDRLIEDESRRFHGEFFTPTEWVLEAHKMIAEVFGDDWKEKYVVWDPAWGTGNLTRDFKFNELYCSTLDYGQLEIGKHYNPEAVKFQYDFLNDDVTPEGVLPIDKIKLPRGLVEAFEKNKPIIIFMNPPFGTEANIGKKKNKEGISKNTLMYKIMEKEKAGKTRQDLYAQFLYRILKIKQNYKNKNIHISTFSSYSFLATQGSKLFRDQFLKEFCFKKGFYMNAGEFQGTVSSWGIIFSIWFPKENNTKVFSVDVKENSFSGIKTVFTKDIYNTDCLEKANDWSKEKLCSNKKLEFPKLSSALKIKEYGMNLCNNSLGFFTSPANNIKSTTMGCYILSAASSQYYGNPITKENFNNVVSFYTARQLSPFIWYNMQDEYLKPNTIHVDYQQWNKDCIIFSLFSEQSSLRKITYKNKIWDIKNEWFWMSNKAMLELAEKHTFDELYHDAKGDHDRFVFNKIKESTFSEDAALVLNKAIELVEKTFPYRKALHEEHPEWHLNAWDAGWYQIKLILKVFLKDDLKEFNLLYKKFEDRMREGVYKFGFLK